MALSCIKLATKIYRADVPPARSDPCALKLAFEMGTAAF